MILNLTNSTINETLLSNDIVLLDFWAPWCGPCRTMMPILTDLSNEHPDVVIGKIDTGDNTELAMKYNVRSIPALFLIKNGEVIKSFVGFQTKKFLSEELEKLKK